MSPVGAPQVETVNTSNAVLYADYAFASTNHPLADGDNTFTAVAHDSYGRWDTNTITAYLPASVSFSYDSNGNLTSDGARNFEYDAENQLTNVYVSGQWRSQFVYDGKMRRRIRREYTWQSGIWNLQSEIRYLYDGNLVIQERDANNQPQVTYTRGRDLSGTLEGAGGIGGMLARTDCSLLALGSLPHALYHADGNGNITAMISTNQQVVARYLYDPYGNLLGKSGPLADANLYRFSSKEWHPASGLVYYLYRYYEPNLQRWMNRDPNREAGFRSVRNSRSVAAGSELNLCLFVANDPVTAYDPFGLARQLETDIQSCLDNCLDDRNSAALGAVAKACKHHIWGHIIGGGGTAISGLIVGIQHGANLVADLIAMGFGLFEAYEIVATLNEGERIKTEAQSAFVACCDGCGKKWTDPEVADKFKTDHPLK